MNVWSRATGHTPILRFMQNWRVNLIVFGFFLVTFLVTFLIHLILYLIISNFICYLYIYDIFSTIYYGFQLMILSVEYYIEAKLRLKIKCKKISFYCKRFQRNQREGNTKFPSSTRGRRKNRSLAPNFLLLSSSSIILR